MIEKGTNRFRWRLSSISDRLFPYDGRTQKSQAEKLPPEAVRQYSKPRLSTCEQKRAINVGDDWYF